MCTVCNKVIKHKGTYNRHVQSHKKSFKCFLCDVKFTREENLKKHERRHLSGYKKLDAQYNCHHCREVFNNYTTLFDHVKKKHPHTIQYGSGQHQTSTDNALEDSVHVLKIFAEENDRYDLLTFDANIRDKILYHLKQRCEKVNQIKWLLNVQVECMRETNDGETAISQPYFRSKTYTLLSKEEISVHDINEAFQKQFSAFDEYIARGSGWTLKQVLNMEVHILQYRPIGYMELPDTLKNSKAILNIKNSDQKCFLWSVLAALHPVHGKNNPNRVSHYTPFVDELNMSGISYPVQIAQINKF